MRRSLSADDDLVGRAHVLPAHALALEIRRIGLERAAPLGAGGVERILRAGQDFVRRCGRGAAP